MDRHYYAEHALTIARHPSETDERMMVRCLAFALHASDSLAFGRGLSDVDDPDLSDRDLTGAIQLWIDGGDPVAITWQILPYALLTFGEVLVSATGLEFAYSQAPLKMKGVLMSFWSLSVTVGSLWVLLVNASVRGPRFSTWIAQATGASVTAFQMYFFAGFAFAAALAFGLYARRYTMADYYRKTT